MTLRASLVHNLQATAADYENNADYKDNGAATARGPQTEVAARSHAAHWSGPAARSRAHGAEEAAQATERWSQAAAGAAHATTAAAAGIAGGTAAVEFAAAKSAAGAHPKSSVKV
jgi:hypothetical protein